MPSLDSSNVDPFGYDKNDLNLDHFTQNIIPKLCFILGMLGYSAD